MAQPPKTSASAEVGVYYGAALGTYEFGDHHPFGMGRLAAFWEGVTGSGLVDQISVEAPVSASRAQIERFHSEAYVARVMCMSDDGVGFLDSGDTPAFPGIYEAAAFVVGSVAEAASRIANGSLWRAFVPIAGLHHARRDSAGGFCVFNDCGVAIELLREIAGLRRIAYVNIDAHHGDGVFYSFEEDPDLFIGDIHEDGRFLYPGTGHAQETGRGAAVGTKLNFPLAPGAGDREFTAAWEILEDRVDAARPEFILLQCGADGLAGDPLTHLKYSESAHSLAAEGLCRIADRHCDGRLLALGGGGYDNDNLARAWCAVINELVG